MKNLNHHKVFGQALILGVALLVAVIALIAFAISSEAQNRIPPAPDAQDQTLQFFFDGKWYPSVDPAKIGPNNYAELKNLRYSPEERGLEGVSGYSKINTTALSDAAYGSDYYKIRNGFQLQTDRTTSSYIFVQAENSGETASRLYVNTASVPATGNFATTVELDTSGNAYVADTSGAGLGRFSDAPLGSVAYANGVENLIWSGEEMRVGEIFLAQNSLTSDNPIEYTAALSNTLSSTGNTAVFGAPNELITNGNMEADSNWADEGTVTQSQSDTQAFSGTYSRTFDADAADEGIESDTFSTTAGVTYYYRVYVYPDDTTDVNIRIRNAADDGDDVDSDVTGLTQDSWNAIMGSYTAADTGSAAYINIRSTTANGTGVFYVDEVSIYSEDRPFAVVLTRRPIQGIRFVVKSGSENTVKSVLTERHYTSSGWTNPSVETDGTSSGDIALAQSGWLTFDYTSDATPLHFQGRYMYGYRFELTGGSATIEHVSVNAPMQDIVDLWDGVPRQPISFQVWDNANSKFKDYTDTVNYQSVLTGDSTATVAVALDSMTADDYFVIMADDRLSGATFNMVSGAVNASASVANVLYWNGSEYTAVSGTETDGTSLSGATLGQSGLLWWNPPSESSEVKKTEFGKTGYSYKITISGALSADVDLDTVTLATAQKSLPKFSFPATYNNRLLLCGDTTGKEANRCDFSQTNSTEVWNGAESSDGGTYSLYFGGSEPVTAAMEIFNRYGSRVETKFVVFKDSEIHTVEGDTVEDMLNGQQRVTTEVGCPAPLTLMNVPVGYAIAQDVLKNMLFWIDTAGPMSFDGELVIPIRGVEKYFDPDDDDCVNFDEIERAVGWYDAVRKEINFLLPSGSGQSTNNLWLVYEPRGKRWFRKDTGTAAFPQVGFMVQDAYGTKYPYGGIDTGFLMRLENGNSWADTADAKAIEQVVETGDFWPTGNSWDLTRIRHLKIMAKRLVENHQVTVQHYSDTNESQGLDGIWMDEQGEFHNWEDCEWVDAALESVNLFLTSSLNRIARDTIQDNLFGWAHRFKFSVSTDETAKGFQPVGWGVVFHKENRFDQ